MWPLIAIVIAALGLLYAWWPLRRGADAHPHPLPDEGATVGDPSIAREAFEVARRWSAAAGEIGNGAVAEMEET